MDDSTGMTTEQLERSLIGNDDSDDEGDQFETDDQNSEQRSGQARQLILQCLQCNKEFDSSQINADVATSLCSICNTASRSNSFPVYKSNGGGRKTNGKKSSKEKEGAENEDNTDESDKEQEKMQNQTEQGLDYDVPEFVDDDEEPEIEKLPVYQDAYQQGEIPDYTGFKDAKELGAHFIAGGLAGDGNTVGLIIGNLGILEFTQSRHPDAYGIAGKDTFWTFVRDPYEREKELIMYGYDLYDAMQSGEVAYVCNCMIIGQDGFPTGQILYKIGRTRCPTPRNDGFIYDIREKQVMAL